MSRIDRPFPRQDLDESRLDAARRRREAEGRPSLGDEAIAHEREIPPHRTPGADDGDGGAPGGEEIARRGGDGAASAAQTGKPMARGRGGR